MATRREGQVHGFTAGFPAISRRARTWASNASLPGSVSESQVSRLAWLRLAEAALRLTT